MLHCHVFIFHACKYVSLHTHPCSHTRTQQEVVSVLLHDIFWHMLESPPKHTQPQLQRQQEKLHLTCRDWSENVTLMRLTAINSFIHLPLTACPSGVFGITGALEPVPTFIRLEAGPCPAIRSFALSSLK